MLLKQFHPNQKLQRLIKRYWLLEVNEFNDEDNVHSFFPLDAIEIIFHLKNPFLRFEQNMWIPEPDNFIEGQQSGTINVKRQGLMKTIGITLYPWASTFFYNTLPSAFTDCKFQAEGVDRELDALYFALAENNNNHLIPELCDNYFLAKFQHCQNKLTATDQMLIELMGNSTNCFTPKEVKNKWSFSSRYFEKKCLDLLGVTAGYILKKRRMKKVLEISMSQKFISFTDVAHATGYYDQAHFIKDFKYYFEKSPMDFFKHDNVYLRNFL